MVDQLKREASTALRVFEHNFSQKCWCCCFFFLMPVALFRTKKYSATCRHHINAAAVWQVDQLSHYGAYCRHLRWVRDLWIWCLDTFEIFEHVSTLWTVQYDTFAYFRWFCIYAGQNLMRWVRSHICHFRFAAFKNFVITSFSFAVPGHVFSLCFWIIRHLECVSHSSLRLSWV